MCRDWIYYRNVDPYPFQQEKEENAFTAGCKYETMILYVAFTAKQ